MMNFTIDKEKCIKCKLCAAECPVLIIDRKSEYPEIKEGKEGQCIKCQHCLAVCPTGALSIWDKNPADSVPVDDQIPEPKQMAQMIKTRRSIRKFTDEAISKDLIHDLVSTAAYAPTSKNENAVLFTVVDNKETLATVRSLVYDSIKTAVQEGRLPEKFSFLSNFQAVWESKQIDVLFRNAPHFLITSASKESTNPKSDALIALSYFELLANSHGIGTMWDGFAKWAINEVTPIIRKQLGIPEDHLIAEVMLFGHSAVRYARAIQSDGLNLNIVSM